MSSGVKGTTIGRLSKKKWFKTLTLSDFKVLHAILEEIDEGMVTATQPDLAKASGVSIKSVERSISKLKKGGFLTVLGTRGHMAIEPYCAQEAYTKETTMKFKSRSYDSITHNQRELDRAMDMESSKSELAMFSGAGNNNEPVDE